MGLGAIRFFAVVFLSLSGFQVMAAGGQSYQIPAPPENVQVSRHNFQWRDNSVDTLIVEPKSEAKLDQFYFLGMGDTPDTHRELFYDLAEKGVRVIAPSYPGHGHTKGPGLNRTTFGGLSELANLIERKTRQDEVRPMILSGWSMGGLLAYRMAQDPALALKDRPLGGLMLYSPTIYPRYFIGSFRSGLLTTRSISNNPNPPNGGKMGIPLPAFQIPVFLTNLLYHANQAQNTDWDAVGTGEFNYPLSRTPILVFLGAEKGPNRDRSVDSRKVRKHFEFLDEMRDHASSVDNMRRTVEIVTYDAPHALDWEHGKVADNLRAISARFAEGLAELKSHPLGMSRCVMDIRHLASQIAIR